MREADEREEERAAAAEAEAEEAANARPTTQSQGFVAYGRSFIWQFKDEFPNIHTQAPPIYLPIISRKS